MNDTKIKGVDVAEEVDTGEDTMVEEEAYDLNILTMEIIPIDNTISTSSGILKVPFFPNDE